MPVITAAITQHGEESTPIPTEYAEPRNAVRISFGVAQEVWIVSHEDCIDSLPAGASVLSARLLDEPLPNINRNAGFDTGISTITAPTYKFVDVDDSLSHLLANKNVNGEGSFNRLIEEWEFEKGTSIVADDGPYDLIEPKFTGIIQDHSKPLNTVEIQTADINRGADEEVFDPLQWRLNSSIGSTDTTIPTTLSPLLISQYEARFQHREWYIAHPGKYGGYCKIEDEIFWYTKLEDVNGIATFTGVERGVLRTSKAEHSITAGTEDKNKTAIDEWIVIDEPATDIPKMLLSGRTADLRLLPAHWCVTDNAGSNVQSRWIDYPSFAANSSSFRLQFQGLTKTKAREFYQKEVLMLMGAVLAVNGRGKLVWTPRVRPVDTAAGALVLDHTNCIDSDLVLKHVKTGIHPSVKINYDHDALTDSFLSKVTYRDVESELHNNIAGGKKVKEFSFKGLHAGIHTGTQLQKLAATFGDDYFYEKLSLTIESRINNIRLGTLVTVDFPHVKDDANGTAYATGLNRTMLVTQSIENRAKRTTTYTLSGSLYVQSLRQASNRQNNLEPEEYKRGKINLATLPGITISNGIATGSITLQMGKHYYYVNDSDLGAGLEFSASLNVNITGYGGLLGLHIFGPFVNKTTLNLSARSSHDVGVRAADGRPATKGVGGYTLTSRSSGSIDVEEFYNSYLSSDRTIYSGGRFRIKKVSQPLSVSGQYATAPDPVINVNNGLLGGVPADLGGTSGSGSPISVLTDSDRRPQFSGDQGSPNPSRVVIEGSNGGRGGGGLLIVSWGGGIQGDGEINLSGGNAQSNYSHTLANGRVINGSRGGPGMPGSLLWIVDGNHSTPVLNGTVVKAFPGNASVTGTAASRIGATLNANTTYKCGLGATPSSNLYQSVVRVAFTPEPETVQELPLGIFSEFFTNQRDDQVQIFVGDVDPSNANPADMRITEANLNSGLAQPPFRILDVSGWRDFVYGTDRYQSIYLALIANRRAAGGDTMLSQTTRPVGQTGNLWHNPNTGNIVRLLENGPPDQLVFSGEVPVGSSKYIDGNLTRYKAGEVTWVFTDDVNLLPTFPPEKIGGDPTNDGGNYTLSPPISLEVYVYSGTTVELVFGHPANAPDEGIIGYEIRQDDELIDTITGGSKLVSSLTPSTSYTFSVRSVNATGGRSPDVSDTIITSSTGNSSGGSGSGSGSNALPPPFNLTASVYSSSALELFWNIPVDITDITGYQIRRNGTLVGSVGKHSGSYFESSGLDPSTLYTYTVRSINATERSDDVTVQATTNA